MVKSEKPDSDLLKEIIGSKKMVSVELFPPITVIRPDKENGVVSVKGLLIPHYIKQTEFNHAVITFGEFFEEMKGIVPLEQRWGFGTKVPENVFIFPADENMDNLTRLANTAGVYENPALKKEYRKNLEEVLAIIAQNAKLDPNATIVAIKRAGVVVAQFLHQSNRFLTYEAKRLPFADGTLGVGMEDQGGILTPENLDRRDLEVDEVFLASGVTILAFMIDCYSREIRPKSLTIVAPFITQQGAEAVLNLSSQIGWQTRILGSRIYYWLNNRWYVLVTPEEQIWDEVSGGDTQVEVQAGGDAGDLTEI